MCRNEVYIMPLESSPIAHGLESVLLTTERGQLEVVRPGNFYLRRELRKLQAPFIEVAGPTREGFVFHDLDETGELKKIDLAKEQKVFVSNLYSGKPEFEKGGFVQFYGLVDFVTDARITPIRGGSIGALFCSCLGEISSGGVEKIMEKAENNVPVIEKERSKKDPHDLLYDVTQLRKDTMDEAWRILREGGYLIWQGANLNDLDYAKKKGFTVVQSERLVEDNIGYEGIVFKKETKK